MWARKEDWWEERVQTLRGKKGYRHQGGPEPGSATCFMLLNLKQFHISPCYTYRCFCLGHCLSRIWVSLPNPTAVHDPNFLWCIEGYDSWGNCWSLWSTQSSKEKKNLEAFVEHASSKWHAHTCSRKFPSSLQRWRPYFYYKFLQMLPSGHRLVTYPLRPTNAAIVTAVFHQYFHQNPPLQKQL